MDKIRTITIGTGGFASITISSMLREPDTTDLVGCVDVNPTAREGLFKNLPRWGATLDSIDELPPFFASLDELLASGIRPDVAYIASPHKYHIDNIRECLKAGINVLVEKPMVISGEEAEEVIRLRDETGKLVVVGFPGSLSPATTKAKEIIARGEIGALQGVVGIVHQKWKPSQKGTWRQNPEISGGGFLFDTGSHLINTIVDVVGEDIGTLTATLDNCGTPVEINSSISATFKSGIKLSILGIGNSFDCKGDIRIIGEEGVIEIGMWGHYLRLFTAKTGGYTEVSYGEGKSTWGNFLDVYYGKKENPCPAEVGLRFARLMDMIRESSEKGLPVKG